MPSRARGRPLARRAGRGGSAVSIGLLAGGTPRLGVVFAFAHPDDAGDLFAWAEGCGPLRRNDRAVETRLREGLGPLDVVLVSSTAEGDPGGTLACVAPARYRTVPSIAHRLPVPRAGGGGGGGAPPAPARRGRARGGGR